MSESPMASSSALETYSSTTMEKNSKNSPAYWNFEGYAPKFFSFLHLNMHPPAVQLFWEHQKLPVISTCLTDREWTTYAKPNHFFTRFLDENCPGWGIRPHQHTGSGLPDHTVFLAKRSHTLLICRKMDELLKGIPSKIR